MTEQEAKSKAVALWGDLAAVACFYLNKRAVYVGGVCDYNVFDPEHLCLLKKGVGNSWENMFASAAKEN